MTLPRDTLKRWDYRSCVTVCPDCEGSGTVASHHRPTVIDPYPERPCDCGLGEHEPECPVCGYNLILEGFDCLACETIAFLNEDELLAFDPDSFAAAIRRAYAAASAEPVATASEASVPPVGKAA